MPNFTSVKELKAYVQNAINDTLEHEVAEVATEALLYNIDKVVYDYTPVMYQRRESGGLGSEESVKTALVGNGTLEVESSAESSPSVVHGGVSDELASWIINGDVPNIFNDRGDTYPWNYPRDYISETVEDPDTTRMIKDAINAGLKRHGISIKYGVSMK